MIYGYIRVSTEKQTVANQKLAIKNYAVSHKIGKIRWVEETVSGTKSPEKRKLGVLLRELQAGDTVIVTELSRLGRSLMMILNVLQTMLEKKVRVFSLKEGYELGDNIQSKVIAFAFGLAAEIERNLISDRTVEGLARAKSEGKTLGRPKGRISSHYKLTGKGAYIKRSRLQGKSKSELSQELGVTWVTLNGFMKKYHIK